MLNEPELAPLRTNWNYGRLFGVHTVPAGWRLVRLTEIAKLESGHTPDRNTPAFWNGGINWLSLHDTKHLDEPVLNVTVQQISRLGIQNSSARILPSGTVALSRTATIGKCVILGQEMATSQDFACYICGKDLDPRYLLHLFRYMQPVWATLSEGSTHKTVYMPAFEKLQILAPPTSEQRKIAEILDSVDDSIRSTKRLIEKSALITNGLMADLLGHRGKNDQHSVPLSSLVDTMFAGEWGDDPDGTGVAVRVVRATEFDRSGRLSLETAALRRVPTNKVAAKHLKTGDLVIEASGGSTDRPVGRVAMFPGAADAHPYLCSNFFRTLRLLPGAYPQYMWWLLRYRYLLPSIWAYQQQTTGIMNLKVKDYMGQPIHLPSLEDQRRIVYALDAADKLGATDRRNLAKLEELKRGLAHDLLTGRVRVKVEEAAA